MGIIITSNEHLAFTGGTVVKNLPAKAEDTRDASSIPELGRSPGLGNGNLLQYSCLENPMVRGAWWATVNRVAKSWTQLIDWEHTMSTYYVPDISVICLDFPFSTTTLIGSMKHKRTQRHHEFLGKMARVTRTVRYRVKWLHSQSSYLPWIPLLRASGKSRQEPGDVPWKKGHQNINIECS